MKTDLISRTWEETLLSELFCTNKEIQEALLSKKVSIHLCVFQEPYLSYILEGRKTVESRFSINKCAPVGRVESGDILLLKKASGPVVAMCSVDHVWTYILDTPTFNTIRKEFSRSLCAEDPSFWDARKDAKFATLMRIKNVVEISPIHCGKRDRRGWVVLGPRIKHHV